MPVKVLCSGVVLGMALVSQLCASAPLTAENWLQRLQSAQGTQSFQGSFVYERKGAFSTHQVWRQLNAQGQLLERFIQLNGPAHEVMRVDGHVTCMSAQVADEFAAVDIWPAGLQQVRQLEQWYDIKALGDSRVAGHSTAILLFTPRDAHRYALELHIDQHTAIPLKTLLLNEQGQLLERLQFVQFQAQAEPTADASRPAPLTPSPNCEPVQQAQVTEAQGRQKDWDIGWVPDGFVLLQSHLKPALAHRGEVLSQVYSDGLAHFSVFFEQIADLEIEAGRRQIGPTAVVSRPVRDARQNAMVTVVGEVPLGTAERIAVSVHRVQESADD